VSQERLEKTELSLGHSHQLPFIIRMPTLSTSADQLMQTQPSRPRLQRSTAPHLVLCSVTSKHSSSIPSISQLISNRTTPLLRPLRQSPQSKLRALFHHVHNREVFLPLTSPLLPLHLHQIQLASGTLSMICRCAGRQTMSPCRDLELSSQDCLCCSLNYGTTCLV
jgi:hypothetical protein